MHENCEWSFCLEIEIAMPIVNQYHSDEIQDTQNLEQEAKFC